MQFWDRQSVNKKKQHGRQNYPLNIFLDQKTLHRYVHGRLRNQKRQEESFEIAKKLC